MSNKAGEERGFYWWMRYVIVPVIGGGGIIAIIVAVIGMLSPQSPTGTTTPTSPSKIQTITRSPELPPSQNMQWTTIEGHIVLDPSDKYWEKYQDDTDLPGLYLRLKDVSSVGESLGDYLELKSDGTFDLEEAGNRMSGTWQSVAADEITLNFP